MSESRLMEKVRIELRSKHYSRKTESAYTNWIKRFIHFHNKHHPKDMGAEEFKALINNLAINHHVSSATQNQALQGILYLYKSTLNKDV